MKNVIFFLLALLSVAFRVQAQEALETGGKNKNREIPQRLLNSVRN